MCRAFLILFILAVLCLVTTFAEETNTDSLRSSHIAYIDGEPVEIARKFTDFNFDAEWNNNETTIANELSFDESNVGEFELSDQQGTLITIDTEDGNLVQGFITVINAPPPGLAENSSNWRY